MEDVLDLEVSEKEMQFLDEEGDEFPEEGMICPVPACTNGKHLFKKYNNYIAHFDRFHKKNIFIYSCPICKVKDARKSEITRHFKRIHPTHETPALIGKLTNNIKFIDPGTFKKPRKRIHREERERAQQLRRQNLPSQPLFELSDNYNTRDQRYPKGGFLHK